MTGRIGALVIWVVVALSCSVQAQEPRDRVLVVVDRSAVMGQEAARAWAEQVLFVRPEQLTLSIASFQRGLDETTDDRAALLVQKADPTAGFDPEPVLDQLTRLPDAGRWSMVLLIMGGDPTPLNVAKDRNWTHDPRYAELAAEFADWQQAQATAKEMQDYFAPYYSQRQMALMADHARALNKSISSHVVVWDLSGKAVQIRSWALANQLRYVGKEVSGAAQIPDAMDTMRWETQRMAAGPGGGSWTGEIILLVLAGLGFGGFWWWHRRPVPMPAAYNTHDFFAPDPSPAPFTGPEPEPGPVPVPEPVPEPVHEPEPVPAPLPPPPPEPMDFAARLSPGMLAVYWGDDQGGIHRSDGLCLTLETVEFAAEQGVPVRLDRIESTALGVSISFESCDIAPKQPGLWVAVFGVFQGGIDDRMKLLDMMTGIGEG